MNYFKIAKYFLFLPLLFMTVIVTTSTLFPFIVGKYVFFRSVVGIAFILFLLGMLFNAGESEKIATKLKKLIRMPLFIAVASFVVVFLLAGFFGVNPSFSFWSNFERGEGGLQMLTFFVYFGLLTLLFETKEEWRMLFWSAVAGGVLMGLYGFFASFGVKGFIGAKFSDGAYRFQGSIGNPAYVAIYSLFLMFYSLFLFLQKRTLKILSGRTFGFFVLIAFFAAIFLLAATRGAFLGLGTAVIAALLFIGFSYPKLRIKTVGLSLLIVILISAGIYFKNTSFIKAIPGSRIFDISFSTKTFADRATIWKMAWDGFKEKPLLGWGPENFINIFDRHFNTAYFNPTEGFGSWFDRAHSIIFDYLAETGILGFLAYLSMFISFYVMFFRHQHTDHTERKSFFTIAERALIFAIPLAYLVQGLVLFDVSVTYLNLFTIFAFGLIYFTHSNALPTKKSATYKEKK